MKLILILVLSVLSNAGRICLPKGWILEWTFPTTQEVSFKLTLDAETSANYGWVGIGFKYVMDPSGMIGSDIANLIFAGELSDRYANLNGLPPKDTDLGGTEDLLNPVGTWENDAWVYTWSREVDSGDKYDKLYIIGNEYIVLWARGMMSDDGVQMKHFTVDRSLDMITLNADFDEGCEDMLSLT